MAEKRQHNRTPLQIKTLVRKPMPDGGTVVMEFRSKDLSRGGVFVSTEDLSIFDLGEEIEVLVDDRGERFYTGNARVVRSARIFSEDGTQTESGFGLMFIEPDESFVSMLVRRTDKEP